MALLSRAFFDRPCLDVAVDLLGCRLVRELDGRVRLEGRIVEVEAYLGDGTDPSAHSHRGLTPRNRPMFGPPGRFYVYRSMGLHACVNVVCEAEGSAAAVLLRAVEPLEGLDAIRAHRPRRADRELTNGPGKLAQAFAIGLERNDSSALRGPLRIEAARPCDAPARILCSPRIGISQAVDLPYRFFDAGSPFVTRAPQNRRARPLPKQRLSRVRAEAPIMGTP